MSDIYSDLIIENYKYPKNFGVIDHPTSVATVNNVSCGDELTVYLLIKDNRVKDISYTGSGCAICLGTMSILSQYIRDMDIDKIEKIEYKSVFKLINMSEESGRIKCATLSLDAVHKCIKKLKSN